MYRGNPRIEAQTATFGNGVFCPSARGECGWPPTFSLILARLPFWQGLQQCYRAPAWVLCRRSIWRLPSDLHGDMVNQYRDKRTRRTGRSLITKGRQTMRALALGVAVVLVAGTVTRADDRLYQDILTQIEV